MTGAAGAEERRGRGGGFGCVVVGEGPLPLQCAELLLERGHRLLGVASPDPAVRAWAAARGLPARASARQVAELVEGQGCDYLFSIVNHAILPPEVLRLPRRWAVNYHNAPLPRYAGVNAASWALLHAEPVHGVTWHVMAEQVDAGELLKQLPVPIDPAETALSLMLKCHAAALEAFAQLLEELEAGLAAPWPQALEERSYFTRHQRPPAGCVLEWGHEAARLDALVRALDFGPYPNEMGLPKLMLPEGGFALVRELRVLEPAGAAAPGTVRACAADVLRVSTATQDVELGGLLGLDGEPLPAKALPGAGARLPLLGEAAACEITAAVAEHAAQEPFWVRRLARAQMLPLEVPPHQAEAGRAALPVRLPARTELLLRARAADAGVGTAELLAGAFAVLLGRVAETEGFDLAFRGPAQRVGGAGAGLFATHAPLRIEAGADLSLVRVAGQVAAEVEVARRRGTYLRDLLARHPELRERAGLGRLPGGSACVVQGGGEAEAEGSLLGLELGAGGEARWSYDAGQVERGWAEGLLRVYESLLERLLEAAEAPAGTVPLLGGAERERVLGEWNRTAAPLPECAGFVDLFEAQAERTPGAPAVADGARVLGYAELESRANRLARYLRARGVGPEVRVGVCVERGVEMVVALLGVLKAGGAYVPLDPAYPRERIGYVLEDSGARVLLSQGSVAAELEGGSAQVVLLDAEAGAIAAESAERPGGGATAENLAYTVYTSGSTGRPKGVLVEHRQLLSYVHGVMGRLELPAGASYATVSTVAADLGNTMVFPALCTGGCLHVISRDLAADAAALGEYMERNGVDCLKIVPSHLAALVASPRGARVLPRRKLVLGGEASRREWAGMLRSLAPGCDVYNHYGPTETTVGVLTHAVGPADARGPGTVPLGRPLPNSRVYVLDRSGEPVPPGVPGELHVGGLGVARGYLDRPGLTAEKFVPDPFGAVPGARMYRTGDRVRWRTDGTVEFLGRTDHQVKVRGFRVEPGEIETVLRQHPAVAEAVVVAAAAAAAGGPRLLAYVVPAGAPPGRAEVSAFLRERLPEYMVPAAVVVLDALPLTPNGKLDTRALPVPEGLDDRPAGEPPRTRTEEVLAAAWAELLGCGSVGVHESFFDLGGHSLLAMQLLGRVRELFGAELSIGSLLGAPTVAGMAERIESALRTSGTAALPAMRAVPRGGLLPVSYLQQRMWMAEQIGGLAQDVTARSVRLRGRVDVAAYRAAVSVLVGRHEVLRAGFKEVDGVPFMRIAADARVRVPVVDLEGLAPARREGEARRLARRHAGERFDLAHPPLLRLRILRLGDGDHVVLLAVHHLVWDAWSMHLFFSELEALYAGFTGPGAPTLPALPLQFPDYAAWQREAIPAVVHGAHREHWQRRLSAARPVLESIAGHPERSWAAGPCCTRRVELDAGVVAGIRRLGAGERATLFVSLLALYAAALHLLGGEEDLVILTVTAARSRPEVQGMIGCFAGHWPLRLSAGGDPSLREFLRRTRDVVLADVAHQELPVEMLSHRELEVVERLRGGQFQLAQGPGLPLALPGTTAAELDHGSPGECRDLTFDAWEEGAGIAGLLSYSPRVLRRETVERLARTIEQVARQAVADPEAPLSRIRASLVDADRGEAARAEAGLALAAAERLKKLRPRRAASEG